MIFRSNDLRSNDFSFQDQMVLRLWPTGNPSFMFNWFFTLDKTILRSWWAGASFLIKWFLFHDQMIPRSWSNHTSFKVKRYFAIDELILCSWSNHYSLRIKHHPVHVQLLIRPGSTNTSFHHKRFFVQKIFCSWSNDFSFKWFEVKCFFLPGSNGTSFMTNWQLLIQVQLIFHSW